jgi:sugar lactone lactonase YvrE
MVVAPDNSTLIVAESIASRLTAFDIAADGTLSNRRVWAEIDGYPHGICLDADGAVWCAAMLRCLRVQEGGQVLETIEWTGARSHACSAGRTGGRCSSWPPSGAAPSRSTRRLLPGPARC